MLSLSLYEDLIYCFIENEKTILDVAIDPLGIKFRLCLMMFMRRHEILDFNNEIEIRLSENLFFVLDFFNGFF